MQNNLHMFCCRLYGSCLLPCRFKIKFNYCRHYLQLSSPYFFGRSSYWQCRNLLCSLIFTHLVHIKSFYYPKMGTAVELSTFYFRYLKIFYFIIIEYLHNFEMTNIWQMHLHLLKLPHPHAQLTKTEQIFQVSLQQVLGVIPIGKQNFRCYFLYLS